MTPHETRDPLSYFCAMPFRGQAVTPNGPWILVDELLEARKLADAALAAERTTHAAALAEKEQRINELLAICANTVRDRDAARAEHVSLAAQGAEKDEEITRLRISTGEQGGTSELSEVLAELREVNAEIARLKADETRAGRAAILAEHDRCLEQAAQSSIAEAYTRGEAAGRAEADAEIARLKAENERIAKECRTRELATPIEEELHERIDEMCSYLAMGQGFTLNGIGQLLVKCQERMASDWLEIGRLSRELKAKTDGD